MDFYFHSVKAFVEMGGYGYYVWSAYGVGFLILFMNLFFAKRKYSRAIKKIMDTHDHSQTS